MWSSFARRSGEPENSSVHERHVAERAPSQSREKAPTEAVAVWSILRWMASKSRTSARRAMGRPLAVSTWSTTPRARSTEVR